MILCKFFFEKVGDVSFGGQKPVALQAEALQVFGMQSTDLPFDLPESPLLKVEGLPYPLVAQEKSVRSSIWGMRICWWRRIGCRLLM